MQSAFVRLLHRRSLLHFVAALILTFAAATHLSAQTDVIRGTVTDRDGLPLAGVRVTATSIPGSVTRETRTNGRGAFQIAFPGGQGDYIMGYALIGYAFRQFEIKRLADEAVLIADARLSIVELETVTVIASAPQQRVNRNEPLPDIGGTEQTILASTLPPELLGDLAAMAASLPGVLLLPGVDGEPDAFSVLGLGADQNSVTLNGMESGISGLPRDAAISTSLNTSPFDVSRGGFSGANFNVRSSAGSNFRNRGMSLVTSTPQLQWTDRAAQASGTQYTNVSLGGRASGPIVMNKSFYNTSYQVERQLRDHTTLLSTNALGLQTAGVAEDSVTRFLGILDGQGVPLTAGRLGTQRLSDNASVFGSFDFSPPSSSSGQSVGITFNGNVGRQSPVGGGITQLGSASGDRNNFGGGIQGRHSGYFGMILSESAVGMNLSRNEGEPYLTLPAGRVRVNSILAEGASGVQTLTFGGNQSLSSSSQSTGANFQNTLSWFDDGNKHRVRLTTELGYSGSTQDQSSNLLGSFFFNSLEDLEAGRPSSYSRTLTARQRSTGTVSGSLALGDHWARTPDFQIQYGVRLDGSRFTTTPQHNPAVEATFGRRNDFVPKNIAFSPRVGFTWTRGNAAQVGAFMGAARTQRSTIQGGIGVFSNSSNSGAIGSALDNTGLPSGVQQIMCIGPAAPVPDWEAYALDPSSVPDRCADGTNGTVFANSAPSVTLISPDFRPQRNIRSNLSWRGAILDSRFSARVEGTYSINRNQQRTVDLNFLPDMRFVLEGEDDRPVFVEPGSIVPTSGAIASRDARVSDSFARVSEMRSDLQSRTAQLSVNLSPITTTATRFGWSASYTYSHVREQVSGFSSTAGNPLGVEWARSGQGPHQINYSLRYNFFDAVNVSWNGSFRSGAAFTPMIAGDVNGDGYSNDRAYIFPVDAADPAVAAGMSSLLESASDATRECLESQAGNIAARNSCRGPWSSTASLNVTLDRVKFRMPQRANIQFSLSNPLGAADLALNGSGKLKGWGQNAFPDQSLLYVRGFDPGAGQYRYEVNQRFGATRPQYLTLRNPVTLSVTMRVDLGPTRERQMLFNNLRLGRTLPGNRYPESLFRSMGANAILNPMTTILRSQDSLRLTAVQADSIASMNRRYMYRVDSLWSPVARYYAGLPEQFRNEEVYQRYVETRRRHVDMMIQIVPAIRSLLTAEQRRKLPLSVANALDPRYFMLIRNGTGLYESGGGGSVGGVPMGMPSQLFIGGGE
jgi:hypothetical protein